MGRPFPLLLLRLFLLLLILFFSTSTDCWRRRRRNWSGTLRLRSGSRCCGVIELLNSFLEGEKFFRDLRLLSSVFFLFLLLQLLQLLQFPGAFFPVSFDLRVSL